MKKLICLLIDDDDDDREIFAMAAEKISTPVHCIYASDAAEALNLFKSPHFKPDFIFIDLNLPRISGKELFRKIKRMRRLKNVPLVVYSTSSVQSEIDEMYAMGATRFITKPSELNLLSHALEDCFGTVCRKVA